MAKGPAQTPPIRERLWDRMRWCHWCGTPFRSLKDATVEHLKERAFGGTRTETNCVLACQPCNGRRGELTSAEVLRRRALAERDPAVRDALLTQFAELVGSPKYLATVEWFARCRALIRRGLDPPVALRRRS